MIETYKQLPEEGKKWYALACQQVIKEYKDGNYEREGIAVFIQKDVYSMCEAVVELAKAEGHLQ